MIASERNTSDAQVRDSWSYLDQFDRPIVQKEMTLSGGYSRSGTVYDDSGRVEKQTAPCDAASCTAYWVSNTYDLLGRVVEQSRPQSQGNSTPVTTTFAYAGRTQTVTDPKSKVSTKVMDVNGWMRRSRDHDSYGQNFSYDAAGSLIGVTDTASNTLFSASYYYSVAPLQYSTTDMSLGTWSYTYNSLGELVGWTDANSNSFSQTYDALSRVTSRTDQDTGQNEGTTTWTWGTSAGSHNIGQLASVSMSSGDYSEALSYDSTGRLSTRSITADSSTYDVDYTYNNQGLLDVLSYPTSTSSTRVKVKYGYAYGILQSATDWTSGSAGTVYWTANTQNVRGQTTQETLGNGVVTSRSYDAVTGWLNSIQSGLSGNPTGLQNQSYLYDVVGNVAQRQENNSPGITESFYYDNLHRLDYSTLNNGGGTFTNLQLTYDALGNITARTDVNGNATWTYHGTKKYAVANTGSGGVSYSYDNNGNMTSRAGENIYWASFNYPTYLATATENTTFHYGPDRQYYRQDYNGPSGSETTYYIGGLLEKVCPSTSCASGTIDWRHYIIAEGQTVAIVSRKSSSVNAVHYPLEDHQGSGSVLTNSSGTNVVRMSYGAFGLPRDGSDWDGAVPSGDLTVIEGISRRGYTSHSMLGRMGLIHMNGRVQDAITGRFLSPDPFVQSPGFTQSYNRYSYVFNNPLSYIDPSGFAADDILLDHVDVIGICDWLCRMNRNRAQVCLRLPAMCEGDWDLSQSRAGLPQFYPSQITGGGGHTAAGVRLTQPAPAPTPSTPSGDSSPQSACYAPTGNQTSPWRLGWEWLTGTGPRSRSFSDGDAFTELLRGHRNIQNLVSAARSGSIPSTGQWDYSVGGVDGVGLYLKDYSNLLTGGRTGNLAVTYLGSYDVDYSINGSVLSVHVTNASTIQSATHPPIVGYTDWWGKNIGDRLDSAFSSGPMSRTTQQIDMTFNLAGGCP